MLRFPMNDIINAPTGATVQPDNILSGFTQYGYLASGVAVWKRGERLVRFMRGRFPGQGEDDCLVDVRERDVVRLVANPIPASTFVSA